MDTPTLIHKLLQKKENQKLALQEDLILEVTTRIIQLMEEQGVSRADLARELGTSRANITGLLSGERNMTLRTLADVLFALGRKAGFRDSPFHAEEPSFEVSRKRAQRRPKPTHGNHRIQRTPRPVHKTLSAALPASE